MLRLILLVAMLVIAMAFIELNAIVVAFEKLGLSRRSIYLALIATLLGSYINVPLFKFTSRPSLEVPPEIQQWMHTQHIVQTSETIVAVNIGGCVIPVIFSIYLYVHTLVIPTHVILAVAIMAGVAYGLSRTVPGSGITLPVVIPPVTAAIVAAFLEPEHRAALAYIGGTLGVLIGADLLRLREIPRIGVKEASIGGAGTFDGIFITGIVAVLLA